MRSHVGFDTLWSMRIPVPYSLLLRSDGHGWSCGQCPLDRDGAVIAPGDVLAQADVVAGFAETVLGRGGFGVGDLVMAVVYTAATDPAPVLSCLRAGLGDRALFVPVIVPDFYYPGMEIELDLFAVAGGPGPQESMAGRGWTARVVTARGLRFSAAILADGADITGLRSAAGLDAALIEHWSRPDPAGLPGHSMAGPSACLWAVTADGATTHTLAHGPASVTLRTAPGWLSLTGLAHGAGGLVAQTEAIMQALGHTLQAQGAGFADVVKSTTHYVGDPTPEALHANMEVRNRRYRSPGPASTGIRVPALAEPGALTAISLLAHVPALQSAPESV